jgi:hypothetical protein
MSRKRTVYPTQLTLIVGNPPIIKEGYYKNDPS